MSPLWNAFWGFAVFFAILFFYNIGAKADEQNTLWATCTNGESIKPCELTSKGIIINGKYVDVEMLDVVIVNGNLKVLYRRKNVK